MRSRVLGALAGACLLCASPAKAATYLFQIEGHQNASFELPSSPTPEYVGYDPDRGYYEFALFRVPALRSGTPIQATLFFYSEGADGGFDLFTGGVYSRFVGPGGQLFTGLATAPTFRLGLFELFDLEDEFRFSQLRVTEVAEPAGAPEPWAWGLMILGFGMAGGALRRRRAANGA